METLGRPWETRGESRKPQDGLQMASQRLIEDPLVAKRWPRQPGQDVQREKAYFQGAWQDQNVGKTHQIMRFAHILCVAFWKPFGTRFGMILVHFRSIWGPGNTMGIPSGGPKGHGGVPRATLEICSTKIMKKHDFRGPRGITRGCDFWWLLVGFGGWWTSVTPSRTLPLKG